MANLSDQLKRFINTSRGRGRLDPAPERDAIGIATSEGLPTANETSTGGGGIASPLTEQAYTGATFYNLTSSDGFFVLEYPATTEYLDANSDTVEVVHLDPSP